MYSIESRDDQSSTAVHVRYRSQLIFDDMSTRIVFCKKLRFALPEDSVQDVLVS